MKNKTEYKKDDMGNDSITYFLDFEHYTETYINGELIRRNEAHSSQWPKTPGYNPTQQ